MDETRKNRVIVTTRTLRALLFLSLSLNEAANEVEGRRKYSKNHYRRNFHTFRNSLGKAFNPREEKMRRSEGEREREKEKERPSPSEASKRAGARASSFSISAPLCPFHRGPSSAKRLADCSYCPRRNGLLGFPSGFLHPVSPSVFPT